MLAASSKQQATTLPTPFSCAAWHPQMLFALLVATLYSVSVISSRTDYSCCTLSWPSTPSSPPSTFCSKTLHSFSGKPALLRKLTNATPASDAAISKPAFYLCFYEAIPAHLPAKLFLQCSMGTSEALELVRQCLARLV